MAARAHQEIDLVSCVDTVVTLPAEEDGSETNYCGSALEHEVEEFMKSQYTSKTETEIQDCQKNVQKWVSATTDQSDFVSPDSDTVDGTEVDLPFGIAPEDIEKIAAVLSDTAKNYKFDPNAWNIVDDTDQEVPVGNFKENFIRDIETKFDSVLMDIVHVYCAPSGTCDSTRYLYREVLFCVLNKNQDSTSLTYPTFDSLSNFCQGKYFSELKLSFKKKERISKQKLLIIAQVEKYVSDSIKNAYSLKSGILFTGFPMILNIVENTVTELNMQLSPDQIAKCGLLLQKGVYHEMIDRCLDFLAFLGFDLRFNPVEEEELRRPPISFACSQSSGSFNSQQIIANDTEFVNSQGSCVNVEVVADDHNGNMHEDSNANPQLLNTDDYNDYYLLPGSPASQGSVEVEYSRDVEYSPAGSDATVDSYHSNISISPSPPSYSLPERGDSPTIPTDAENWESNRNELAALEETQWNFDWNNSSLTTDSAISTEDQVEDTSTSQDGGGEPQRRRRRLI